MHFTVIKLENSFILSSVAGSPFLFSVCVKHLKSCCVAPWGFAVLLYHMGEFKITDSK